jgi:hypothetical protein
MAIMDNATMSNTTQFMTPETLSKFVLQSWLVPKGPGQNCASHSRIYSMFIIYNFVTVSVPHNDPALLHQATAKCTIFNIQKNPQAPLPPRRTGDRHWPRVDPNPLPRGPRLHVHRHGRPSAKQPVHLPQPAVHRDLSPTCSRNGRRARVPHGSSS